MAARQRKQEVMAQYHNPDTKAGWWDGFTYHKPNSDYEIPEWLDPGAEWLPLNDAGKRAMARVKERLDAYVEKRRVEMAMRTQANAAGGWVDPELRDQLQELNKLCRNLDKQMRERQKDLKVYYPDIRSQLLDQGEELISKVESLEEENERLKSENEKVKVNAHLAAEIEKLKAENEKLRKVSGQ